jgi:hypothetical protein
MQQLYRFGKRSAESPPEGLDCEWLSCVADFFLSLNSYGTCLPLSHGIDSLERYILVSVEDFDENEFPNQDLSKRTTSRRFQFGWTVSQTVFWIRIRIRIHMFLDHKDPDPLVRGMDPDPDPSILLSLSKNSKKNLDFYSFVTSF